MVLVAFKTEVAMILLQMTCNAVTLPMMQCFTPNRIVYREFFNRFSYKIVLSQLYPVPGVIGKKVRSVLTQLLNFACR